ncbi:hypothetical protein AWW66_23920 [Micromonospora rosaria]|uniref:Oligosaccharide repeat unit polymerase n=1 Tax=Micromonospora rosaria TaxID=47874 RepID=A0A136PM72_9ACTN|nr:hypothetical protein [Micromonospora rosaria]KXK59503.1 hypothetical protein AWW66_23920 [Micromonospora rosaria]
MDDGRGRDAAPGRGTLSPPAPPVGGGARREGTGRLLRRYPVSIALLAPFALLVLPMAIVNQNPQTGFILRLVGLALLGSASVETLGLLFGSPDPQWRRGLRDANAQYPRLYLVARLVALTSIVANLAGAYTGRGTIVAQLSGTVPDSTVGAVASLFSGWGALGFALLVASHVGGHLARSRLYGWLAALTAAQALLAAMTAISAPLFGFVFFVAAAGAVCGIFRLRYLVVGVLVVFLLWPTMFDYRNSIREARGVAVTSGSTAADRLRLDRQIGAVAGYDVPVDLDQPGFSDHLRYGVVPRALDPDRPPISTGQQINRYLGGTTTSAFTFLALGNIWFFEGPVGVVVFYAVWAAVVVLLLRWRGAPGPARLSLLCFVLADPLLWSATYPDASISFIQHVVSAVPVFLVLWLTRRRPDPGWSRIGPGPAGRPRGPAGALP